MKADDIVVLGLEDENTEMVVPISFFTINDFLDSSLNGINIAYKIASMYNRYSGKYVLYFLGNDKKLLLSSPNSIFDYCFFPKKDEERAKRFDEYMTPGKNFNDCVKDDINES